MKKGIQNSLLLLLLSPLYLEAQFTLTKTKEQGKLLERNDNKFVQRSKGFTVTSERVVPGYKSSFRFFLNKGSDGRYGFDHDYWDFNTGTTTGLSGIADGTAGVLASEWFSDHFGAWRLSLGSTLAAGKDTAEKTYQSFLSGGGNMYLKFTTPLIDFSSLDHADKRYFKMFFVAKGGANIPGVGSSVSDSLIWNMDLGLDFQVKVAGNEGLIALFGVFRTGLAHGSKEFGRLVSKTGEKTFGYGAATIGVLVKDVFTIQFNFPVNVFGGLNNQIGDKSPSVSLNILAK